MSTTIANNLQMTQVGQSHYCRLPVAKIEMRDSKYELVSTGKEGVEVGRVATKEADVEQIKMHLEDLGLISQGNLIFQNNGILVNIDPQTFKEQI